MLIEAWARVRPQGWCLQIAGPDEAGCQGSSWKRRSTTAGLSAVVSFLGPVEGPRKQAAFLEADLFVLPTRSESFGMGIAEALAHGLPVLTTTGAPWPMLVEHGCGWWVEPTVDGIAEGLRDATSRDADALRAMGDEGPRPRRGRVRLGARSRSNSCRTYEALMAKRVQ